MKKLLSPAALVCIAVAVLGAILRQPAFVALGIIGWVGSVAITSMKDSSKRGLHADQAQGGTFLRTIQRLHRDIEKLVLDNPDNPTVSVIGRDALAESQELLKRAIALSVLIQDTRFSNDALKNANAELAELRERQASSQDERQRESFGLAIQARENEISHYTKIQETIVRSKQQLTDAETALSAIKAQLAAAIAGGATDVLDTDSLSGMVGRLKSLSSSLEEVEEMKERI